MKLTFPVLVILALAFLPACCASALEPPAAKIPSLTIAVPVGFRPAVSSISGMKLQILEYDELDSTADTRFLSDFSDIDLLATFGESVPEGFVVAGSWLTERPAISFRNDLGGSYLEDTTASVAYAIDFLRGVIADDGLPRLAANDGFFAKFSGLSDFDSALHEIDSLTQKNLTDSPLQTLLRGDAEAALLDGPAQARLALVPGRMKDRISSVYLSRQGLTLRLLTRKGNANAASVAVALISSAGNLRLLGFLACE